MKLSTLIPFVGFQLLVSAAPAMNERQSSPLHSGAMTFFNPNGQLGACGNPINNDDRAVAIPASYFNNGANCGYTINIVYNDQAFTGTVADVCGGCQGDGIDVTSGFFTDIVGSTAPGQVDVVWYSNGPF